MLEKQLKNKLVLTILNAAAEGIKFHISVSQCGFEAMLLQLDWGVGEFYKIYFMSK